jgi:hypothetical protein
VRIYALELREEVEARMDDPDMNVERIALKISKGMKPKKAESPSRLPGLKAGACSRFTLSREQRGA